MSVTRLGTGAGVTAWRQIADDLAAEIGNGAYRRGDRLPAEGALAARFGVNRHTVRRALAALAESGLVRASRGSGTFIEAEPIAYPISARTRFSEIVSSTGRAPAGELVRAYESRAGEAASAGLAIPLGWPVLVIDTLHRADGAPISLGSSQLPLPRFAGFERAFAERGTLSGAFEAFGAGEYRRVRTRITARPATSAEASRLELAAGRVVLVAESVNADADGRPIQFATAVFAADRVEIVVET